MEGSRSGAEGHLAAHNNLFSLVIEHICIQIKFQCRLFVEWEVGSQSGRTSDLKIDSKQHHYNYDEVISWMAGDWQAPSTRQSLLQLRMKLVSSKGLTFTVGMLDIQTVNSGVESRAWEVGMAKKTDIDITMGLRWQKIPQKWRSLNATGRSFSSCKKELPGGAFLPKQERGKVRLDSEKGTSGWYESRIEQLQKQLQQNNQLYQKQKGLLNMFQNNQRQYTEQKNQLKTFVSQLTRKIDEYYLKNKNLEEERVRLMMANLQYQRELVVFNQQLSEHFQRLRHNIKICLTNSIDVVAEEEQPSRDQSSPVVGQSREKGSLLYGAGGENEVSQVSMEGEFSLTFCNQVAGGRQNFSNDERILSDRGGIEPREQEIKQAFQRCLDLVHRCGGQLEHVVKGYASKGKKKIDNLVKSNSIFRNKLSQTKFQQQNNEESLIGYMQELEEGLEEQLRVADERQAILEEYRCNISDLKKRNIDSSKIIDELQQKIANLEKERTELRSELHENNYRFTLKEEELNRKIYQLETGFEQPIHYSHSPPTGNIIMRKSIVFSQDGNLSQQDNLILNRVSSIMRRATVMSQYTDSNREEDPFSPNDGRNGLPDKDTIWSDYEGQDKEQQSLAAEAQSPRRLSPTRMGRIQNGTLYESLHIEGAAKEFDAKKSRKFSQKREQGGEEWRGSWGEDAESEKQIEEDFMKILI